MKSVYFINLIFIFVLDVLFFFSGVCLNSVVIISIWRSVQLRKKLCYFMIMVLSCSDLLGVVANTPLMALTAMLWLTEKLDVNATWPHHVSKLTNIFQASSLLVLLVMNFDRYLATSYPLFHRTLVTKLRLLILLAIPTIIVGILSVMSLNVIPFELHALILFILITPPMLFLNYKLLVVVKKNRRDNRMFPEVKKLFSLKNVSSCLLAVACYVISCTPVFVYIGLRMNSSYKTLTLDSSTMTGMWAITLASMNSTFNCLIFYWKNKVLRTEGLKVMKSIKLWRRAQF